MSVQLGPLPALKVTRQENEYCRERVPVYTCIIIAIYHIL